LKPMMKVEPLIPYDVEAWCCNHVWVHKQPLFLWLMAFSMKIFGVNTLGLRLPSALLGTFMIFCTYRIGKIWTANINIAFIAAILISTSYYVLELSSGRFGLDHNDLAMGAFTTASFWSFCEYTQQKSKWKWAILVGVFAGCAILTKWLTGLLVFGGWAIYIFHENKRLLTLAHIKHYLVALLVCCLIFIPWQWYILHEFPKESAASFGHNFKHISEDLGHPGKWWFHLIQMRQTYSGRLFIVLLVTGAFLSFKKPHSCAISLAMFSMFVVAYFFFSVIVATKMPGLTVPVISIGMIWIAIGAVRITVFFSDFIQKRWVFKDNLTRAISTFLIYGLSLYALMPFEMAQNRDSTNVKRNIEMENTLIYQKLNTVVSSDKVIINCKDFEDTEVRFWQANNAMHWCPTEHYLDSLLAIGVKFAAFKNHGNYTLPNYILNKKDIQIIDFQLK
jgi:4-amino-4-deoxy-L-arabinose transferase-like glycosyltransferase